MTACCFSMGGVKTLLTYRQTQKMNTEDTIITGATG